LDMTTDDLKIHIQKMHKHLFPEHYNKG